MIEITRKQERLSINKACTILGVSRTQYYRKVYGLRDYEKKGWPVKEVSPEQKEGIWEVALNDPEYGYKKIWALMNYRHNISVKKYETYKVMKAEGLLLSVNYTKELREQMEERKEIGRAHV